MDKAINIYEYLLSILSQKNAWLSVKEISEILGAPEPIIKTTIESIYEDRELQSEETRRTRTSVAKGQIEVIYNPDVLISLCFRIKTIQAISVRRNFTKILSEFIVKGYALDDERLKNGLFERFDELETDAISIIKH